MFRRIGLRHKHVDVVTNHFIGRVAEQALSGMIIGFDNALFVDSYDAVNGGIDNGADMRLSVLRFLYGLIQFRRAQTDQLLIFLCPPHH